MEVISPLTVSIERLHTSFKASQVDLFQRYTSEDLIITNLSCSHHIDAIHVMDNNIIKLWQIDTDMICSFNPLLTVHSLSFGQSSMDVGHQCDMQSHSDSHTNLQFFGNMDIYTSPPPLLSILFFTPRLLPMAQWNISDTLLQIYFKPCDDYFIQDVFNITNKCNWCLSAS